MDNSCVIYLVSTSETSQDADEVLPARNDVSVLSSRGAAYAATLAKVLRQRNLSTVYSCASVRATQLAQIISRDGDASLVLRSQLQEVDCGDWAGEATSDIADAFPEDYLQFMRDPALHGYANGENFTEAEQRICKLLRQIGLEHMEERVVVVSHPRINQICLASLMGVPLDRARDVDQDPGCVNVLRFNGEKFTVGSLNQILTADDTEELPKEQLNVDSIRRHRRRR